MSFLCLYSVTEELIMYMLGKIVFLVHGSK